MIHFCIQPLSTQPSVWQSPPPFTRTSLQLAPILLIFPDYEQSFLISLSAERLERLLATDHLLGMEIVTGLACSGLDEKRCVCGVYQRLCDLLRSATSCGQKYAVEFFLLFLFFLFYQQLNEEFAIIVVPLDDGMIYIERRRIFSYINSFKSRKNLYNRKLITRFFFHKSK